MLCRADIPISEAEYLRMEVQSQVRHEYVNGEVFAMTGGTLRHNVLDRETLYVDDLAAERRRLQGLGIGLGDDIPGDYSTLAQLPDRRQPHHAGDAARSAFRAG